jgi:hypothetical protein
VTLAYVERVVRAWEAGEGDWGGELGVVTAGIAASVP